METPTKRDEKDFLHHELTRAIIGRFFAVRSELGPGYSESVYSNALAVALREMGFRVEREVPFEVLYHGVRVGFFRVDLLVDATVIVESKVARAIDADTIAYTLNYLTTARLDVGLILNFNGTGEVKRIFGERLRRAPE